MGTEDERAIIASFQDISYNVVFCNDLVPQLPGKKHWISAAQDDILEGVLNSISPGYCGGTCGVLSSSACQVAAGQELGKLVNKVMEHLDEHFTHLATIIQVSLKYGDGGAVSGLETRLMTPMEFHKEKYTFSKLKELLPLAAHSCVHTMMMQPETCCSEVRIFQRKGASQLDIRHTFVEVYGEAWHFQGGRGLSCVKISEIPDFEPIHTLGKTSLHKTEVHKVINELRKEFTGKSFNAIRKNCSHFAEEFLKRLNVGEKMPTVETYTQQVIPKAVTATAVLIGFSFGSFGVIGMGVGYITGKKISRLIVGRS